MADNDPRQRRPVGPHGRLMPKGRPWRKGQSGNPRGPVRKPRQIRDRAITDFVEKLNSLMLLQVEIDMMKAALTLQGEIIDDILSMLMERQAGTKSDAEIIAKAQEIAGREVERRRAASG